MKEGRFDVDFGPETRTYQQIWAPTDKDRIAHLEHIANRQALWIEKAKPELERALDERIKRTQRGVMSLAPTIDGHYSPILCFCDVKMQIRVRLSEDEAQEFLTDREFYDEVCHELTRIMIRELKEKIKDGMK